MLNFTVGPVMSGETVRGIGAEQVPYFRTPEFSEIMLENERLVKLFIKAEKDARVVFITGSGTSSMEATVMDVLSSDDKVLVIDGGSFGHRFVQMLELHHISHSIIKMEFGHNIKKEQLIEFEGKGYTAFLVNIDETSTGVLYDKKLISDFCRRNNMLFVVDAISSFLADDFDMADLGVDVVIAGSQKALACPPGISLIVLSKRAQERVEEHPMKCMYLSLKEALKNGERGQTPWTPAVGILRQINARLREIESAGGVENETSKVATIATDFRKRIKDMPFEIVSESLSNCVTPLHPTTTSAYDIFTILKNEYNIWVCPNGGELQDKVFRVGHIGALTIEDNIKLVDALKDMQKRGMI
jgi:aspartate aminotransferase-like enzyme